MHLPDPSADDLERFYAALPLGRANAVTARQLAAHLGLGRNGDRILRSLAQHATERGLLVCADSSGYFRPLSGEETDETIGRLRSQGSQMIERASRLAGLRDRHFGQQGRLL